MTFFSVTHWFLFHYRYNGYMVAMKLTYNSLYMCICVFACVCVWMWMYVCICLSWDQLKFDGILKLHIFTPPCTTSYIFNVTFYIYFVYYFTILAVVLFTTFIFNFYISFISDYPTTFTIYLPLPVRVLISFSC